MRAMYAIAVLAVSLAACQQPKQVHVTDGWVRLPAVKDRPAVAYFKLNGGEETVRVVSITSPVAIRSEMHETMQHGSMSSMTPVANLDLPKDGKLAFAPGGRHVMLYSLNPSVKPGGTLPLIFTFADGVRIQYDARVVAAGDPAPDS